MSRNTVRTAITLTLFLWGLSPISYAIVDGYDVRPMSTFSKSTVFIILENATGLPETCTGNFITPHHIITAAHCVTSDIEGTTLRLGVRPIDIEPEMALTIEDIFVHPDYAPTGFERNDLAIIKIKEMYNNERYILHLPGDQENLFQFNQKDPTVTAVGYGQTHGFEFRTDQAQDIGQLRYVRLAAHLTNEKNLTVDQSMGRGVCFGDSGGAIVLRYKKIKYIVGVSSGVFDDALMAGLNLTDGIDSCKQKSIFMNVIYYLPWIQETLLK